jgi:hypothetical protein
LKGRNKHLLEQFHKDEDQRPTRQMEMERNLTPIQDRNFERRSVLQEKISDSKSDVVKLQEKISKYEKTISELKRQNILIQQGKTDLTVELEKISKEYVRLQDLLKMKDVHIQKQEELIKSYELGNQRDGRSRSSQAKQTGKEIESSAGVTPIKFNLPEKETEAQLREEINKKSEEIYNLKAQIEKLSEDIAKTRELEQKLTESEKNNEKAKEEFKKFKVEQDKLSERNKAYVQDVEKNLETILKKSDDQIKGLEDAYQKETTRLGERIFELEKALAEKNQAPIAIRSLRFDQVKATQLILNEVSKHFASYTENINSQLDSKTRDIEALQLKVN